MPKTSYATTIDSDTLRSQRHFIKVNKIENTFTGDIPLMYDIRSTQVKLDSAIKRIGYYKEIIVKKDSTIEELKEAIIDNKLAIPLKDNHHLKETFELKEKNSKNKLYLVGSVALNIILSILIFK